MYRDQNEIVAEFAKSLPAQFDSFPRELMISELKRLGLTEESALILHLNLTDQDSLSFQEVQDLIAPAPMALTESDKATLGEALSAMLPQQKAPVGMFRATLRGLDLSHNHPFMQDVYAVPENAEFTREEIFALATKHGLDLDSLTIPSYANDTQAPDENPSRPDLSTDKAPVGSPANVPGKGAGTTDNGGQFTPPRGASGFAGAPPSPGQEKADGKSRQLSPHMRAPMGMHHPVIDPFQSIIDVGVKTLEGAKYLGGKTSDLISDKTANFIRRDAFREAREAYQSPSQQELFNQKASRLAKEIHLLGSKLGSEQGAQAANLLMDRLMEADIVSESQLSDEARDALKQSLEGMKEQMDALSPEQKEQANKQLQTIARRMMKLLSKLFGGKDLEDELDNDGPEV